MSIYNQLQFSPTPIPWQPLNLFFVSIDLPILDFSYKSNHYNMWPFLSGLFHLASCFQGLSMLEPVSVNHSKGWIVSHCMQTPRLFMHSSVGHLDCFYFLPIMNNSSKNIHVSVFVWTYIFHCLTYLGMELLGHNYPSAFHSTYTVVHFHW